MITQKILFIDDDEALAGMYALKFEKEGFQTKICTDGLTALSVIPDYAPDVIFLDIMMPTVNGYEVLKAIKWLMNSINSKVILFTNLGSDESLQKCASSGADLCLLKANTTPKDAIEQVNKLLFDHKKEQTRIFECPHCHKLTKITISPL